MPDDASHREPAPAVRASDAERHHVAELLGEHAAAGRLTLSELEERVQRAYAAVTRDELAELTRDLPDSTEEAILQPRTAPASVARSEERRRWFFAVMGGSAWRGRGELSGTVNIVSIMGGDDIDLREATIAGSELVINAVAIMGGSRIYVPDTVEVEVSGPTIMGGNAMRGSTRPARPGAPLLHIRTFVLMGGIEVWRLPAEARGLGLGQARRLAKAAERRRAY